MKPKWCLMDQNKAKKINFIIINKDKALQTKTGQNESTLFMKTQNETIHTYYYYIVKTKIIH